jgi:hypothetical protein
MASSASESGFMGTAGADMILFFFFGGSDRAFFGIFREAETGAEAAVLSFSQRGGMSWDFIWHGNRATTSGETERESPVVMVVVMMLVVLVVTDSRSSPSRSAHDWRAPRTRRR